MRNDARSSAPLLVFDGDCGFCRYWVAFGKRLTGERVAYAPFQEVADRYPEIPRENFARAVQLIAPDGKVSSAARAVFQGLAYAPGYAWLLGAYEKIPGFAGISEGIYRFVAGRRSFFYPVTRFLWGAELEPATYRLASWLFLKCLAAIYLIAFVSFGVQATGLIGARGILPISEFLRAVRAHYGSTAGWHVPTLFWLDPSDALVKSACVAGAILSLAVMAGIAWRAALVVLFLLYLSLVSGGQVFMSFQWDFLLLETGFLAIFLRPFRLRIWLFQWLLFRLMFLSGAAKLLSGDPAWRNLTALRYHYETQPLPTPLAWYFHQMPGAFERASVLVMFCIELAAPLLIFAPRRLRFFAAASITTLQILIFITGNYTFFNLLSIALCLVLCDDALLRRVVPGPVARKAEKVDAGTPTVFQRAVTAVLFCSILAASGFQLMETFAGTVPAPARTVLSWMAPYGIVNTYGLFSVMTTWRPEIVIEGSNDGQTWLEYSFRYKPGDLKRRPVWVEPHQPRLDWQMWFAALGNYRQDAWFVNFTLRLLDGSPEVLALLGSNPFPGAPPRYIRARLYDYHFTDFATRRAGGSWWRRELKGQYLPPVSLKGN